MRPSDCASADVCVLPSRCIRSGRNPSSILTVKSYHLSRSTNRSNLKRTNSSTRSPSYESISTESDLRNPSAVPLHHHLSSWIQHEFTRHENPPPFLTRLCCKSTPTTVHTTIIGSWKLVDRTRADRCMRLAASSTDGYNCTSTSQHRHNSQARDGYRRLYVL